MSLTVKTLMATGGVEAFYTLRGPGAVATDPYSGFNTCDYVGDAPEHVAQCRAELARTIAIGPERIFMPRQTHSAHVAVVGDEPAPDLDGVDALVSARPGVALGIHTADCVPVVLCDPVAGVIGAAHSGWRGTEARIAALTVEAMASLGADPGRIQAALGPHICADCFEVGTEVGDRFPGFARFDPAKGKAYVDLAAAVRATLVEARVPEGNILCQAPCSRCNPLTLCSARASGTASARTLTLILRR